jgi:cytidylate kinase
MIKVSEVMLKEVGLTVGTSVKTIAESTGYALVASGKLLAFIPNEIGMALLHQSRVSSK